VTLLEVIWIQLAALLSLIFAVSVYVPDDEITTQELISTAKAEEEIRQMQARVSNNEYNEQLYETALLPLISRYFFRIDLISPPC